MAGAAASAAVAAGTPGREVGLGWRLLPAGSQLDTATKPRERGHRGSPPFSYRVKGSLTGSASFIQDSYAK